MGYEPTQTMIGEKRPGDLLAGCYRVKKKPGPRMLGLLLVLTLLAVVGYWGYKTYRGLRNAAVRREAARRILEARLPGNPSPKDTWKNPIDGLEYVFIPPGSFEMGCVPGDKNCLDREKPRHRVTITKGFWLCRTEVTVRAYRKFCRDMGRWMPDQPSWNGDDHPVVNVTWDDATAYCEWVGGRLPTEAEWEYAARGGKDGSIYPNEDSLSHENANYGVISSCSGKAEGRDRWVYTSPVGSFAPNGYGLYDMAGNVWEWCSDWYDEHYYRSSPTRDPRGPSSGRKRVLRGASWIDGPMYIRVSIRGRRYPAGGDNHNGFRVLLPARKVLNH